MSLYLDGDIGKAYLGRFKIKQMWHGNKLLYEFNPTVRPEPYLPNEYFYFKAFDKTCSIYLNEQTSTGKSGGTTEITFDKSQFTNYQTPTLEYSYNKQTWYPYTLGTYITLNKKSNPIVYFRGDNTSPWFDTYLTTYDETVDDKTNTYTHYHYIWFQAYTPDGKVKTGGNILSLRNKTLSDITTIPCNHAFSRFFDKCSNLVTAPVLSATTLKPYCYGGVEEQTNLFTYKYGGMFSNCTALEIMPDLPATTLTDYCYARMFYSCKALINSVALPATTLADHCYYYMFAECSKLVTASELPATTLADYCYNYMFSSCWRLREAPALPATTLKTYCYAYMFNGCSGLKKAPLLPATTLAENCYSGMFGSCQFPEPPILPATTLANYCYSSMFAWSGLQTPPVLPATALAEYCYQDMFYYSDITVPPALPATTLKTGCYQGMFASSNITKTPSLPATTVVSSCYGGWWSTGMFEGCKYLESITRLPALEIGSTNAYYGMFRQSNVKASATQTAECKYAYRVPNSGTGSADSKSLTDMFTDASDTSKNFTPSINTTFYINVPSF